jgi:hypothetical protein
MNGRIYDPVIGRMISPDPFVQAPDNLQSYNRYSYVINNPLSLTDPSGFNFNRYFGGSTLAGFYTVPYMDPIQNMNLSAQNYIDDHKKQLDKTMGSNSTYTDAFGGTVSKNADSSSGPMGANGRPGPWIDQAGVKATDVGVPQAPAVENAGNNEKLLSNHIDVGEFGHQQRELTVDDNTKIITIHDVDNKIYSYTCPNGGNVKLPDGSITTPLPGDMKGLGFTALSVTHTVNVEDGITVITARLQTMVFVRSDRSGADFISTVKHEASHVDDFISYFNSNSNLGNRNAALNISAAYRKLGIDGIKSACGQTRNAWYKLSTQNRHGTFAHDQFENIKLRE